MKKDREEERLNAGDLAGLCRQIVAERRRMERTRSSREAVVIAKRALDRLLGDLLYELDQHKPAGMTEEKFIIEAIEQCREQNEAFEKEFPSNSPRPLVTVSIPKREKAVSGKEAA